MPDRTIAEKLKYTPGMKAALIHPPSGVDLGVPRSALVANPAEADFVVLFAETQPQAEAEATTLAASIQPDTVAWIGYPKGAKAAGLDISRDTVANFVRTVGLVVNANFSIDEKWSALRVRPLKPGE